MESNFEEPLAFFEYMVNEDNLCKTLNARLYYSDFISYGINLPNEIKYVEQNEYGEYFKSTLSVKNEILPILRIEFEKSKKLIKDKYLKNNPNLNLNLLQYLFNTLQSIIYYNSDFINKYPYILLPIRGIVNFINKKLRLHDMQPFQLNEDNIDTIPINENFNIERTNDEIIQAIFSFMNGKNEKQEIILLKKDYHLLIQYITFLVEKENIPKIQKRLSPKLRKGECYLKIDRNIF